jgi:hypothetical protein
VELFCYLLPKDWGAPQVVRLSSDTLEHARREAAGLLSRQAGCFAAEIWTRDALLVSLSRDGLCTPEPA